MARTQPSPWDYDVAVVGGGPSGAVAAGILAQRGRRVLVLERERFPRFHIGESLLPETNSVLDTLGIARESLEEHFVEKWGAYFVTSDGTADCDIDFAHGRQVSQPRTYQVLRSRFDELLLEHASKAGAEVLCGRALEVEFRESGAELSFADSEGTVQRVSAGALVDASGRSGFLAHRLGLRHPEAELRKVALFAHYEGIPRPKGKRGGDIRIVSRDDMGWVWFIPLENDTTSVGVVLDQDVYAALPRVGPEAALERHLEESPEAMRWMQSARKITPAQVEGDFSYDTKAYAGDRWLLVGDAAAFLDPVFSTGVTLAMLSGQEAAEALDTALARGDLSERSFRAFCRRQRRRYRHFRRFVVAFYTPEFRDILFRTEGRNWIYRSVVSVLAGNWHPSVATRLGVAVFFLLVKFQRLFQVAPRVHGPGASIPSPQVRIESKPQG